ncbi:NAD(P)H-binding protein [Planobispora rosea]|uniref:NAD(P)H-binding protein n=1 Tax=Planobispora rosea TaxID=35762 RepID=UPI000AA55074|nr:NAD(P)H-binding protein [Planobispora rosea]
MRILLIGAGGMIGSRIAAEARERGHEVTGATRSGAGGTRVVDAADAPAVAALAAGHDAVVLAIAPPRDGSEPSGPLLAAGRGVLEGVREAGVRRLVIVGGAGSLEAAPGVRLVDTPGFPDLYRAEALSQAALLDFVREQAGDLDWTYISPPAEITPGERTGNYRLGGDRLLTDADGGSSISAEDYAVALVDELETGRSAGRRITVARADLASNKALVEEFCRAFYNDKDFDRARTLLTDDFANHHPGAGTGPEATVKSFREQVADRFPDFRLELRKLVAEEDHVWSYSLITAGPEVPSAVSVDVWRIDRGRIAEHWDVGQRVTDDTVLL